MLTYNCRLLSEIIGHAELSICYIAHESAAVILVHCSSSFEFVVCRSGEAEGSGDMYKPGTWKP